MATLYGKLLTNDHSGAAEDRFVATVANAGTLNGSVESIIGFPPSGDDGITAGNGWELVGGYLSAGVNTTHSSSASITASVEKNTDGGTTALATAPSLSDADGTGRVSTHPSVDDGTALAVHGTAANIQFADSDVAFVTLSEAGTGGTDPSDVALTLVWKRIADFDPAA